MKISKAESGPQMTVEITPKERDISKEVKRNFTDSLEELDNAVESITNLKDAISNERPSKEDLKGKYSGKFLRYRRKIKDKFNKFLTDIKENLEKIDEISDPEMVKLREILVAEVGELSDGAEATMDLLGEPERENFTKTLEQLASQIEKRKKSITDVIESQFVTHINQNILGKTKISGMNFRIKKRSRIIRQLIEE